MTESVGGEGLTGKLREAHSFSSLILFKTAAGTGVLLLMVKCAQAADCFPLCVCIYMLTMHAVWLYT